MGNQWEHRLPADEPWAESCLDWHLRLLKLLSQKVVAGSILNPRGCHKDLSVYEFGVCVCVSVSM